MPNLNDSRMSKLLWSMVSKAAERSCRHRQKKLLWTNSSDEGVVDVWEKRFCGMVPSLSGLLRTWNTVREKVIS